MKYTFENIALNFDGLHLFIKLHDRILKFTNISDFDIKYTKLSFFGDYIPNEYEIINFKLKDDPTEYLGRFIEFTHDRTGIKVDFSFDRQVPSLHPEPICYSNVEIVTYAKIDEHIQYNNILKSNCYIYDEETGIIRKDFWTPEKNDIYYFINDELIISPAIFNDKFTICQNHLKVCNCFKTEEEAKTIKDKFLKLLSER